MLVRYEHQRIPRGRRIGTDSETTGIYRWNGCRAFYWSFCNEEGQTARFRWPVDPHTRQPEPKPDEFRELEDFLGDEKRTKIGHNFKFDRLMALAAGIETEGRIEDTYIAMHTLKSDEPTLGLKPLCAKFIDYPADDEKALTKEVARLRRIAKAKGWNIAITGRDGPKPVHADYWLASNEILDPYGLGDAKRAVLLWHLAEHLLDEDPVCRKFYERELRLQHEVILMEERGVRIRMNVVEQEIKTNEERMKRNMKILHKEIGPKFNPNSAPQVREFVYEVRGIEPEFYTHTGAPAVNNRALRNLKDPVIHAIRDYKSAEKAISAFFQKYKDNAVLDEDGQHILHPDFNQVGPVTGRFSCKNPNLQNVANALTSRNDIPMQARTPFCPRVGYTWYCFDYSGQEVWIFADGAKEETMLQALFDGRDMHTEAADFIWGAGTVAREAKMGHKNSRTAAKMMFFGIIYGMGVNSMIATLASSGVQVSRDKAIGILEKYHKYFTGISVFMEKMVELARKRGYIQTAWGRKIFVDPDYAYRSVNYYVQGSGADAMKESMLKVGPWLREQGLDAHMLMTIHDELVVEILKSQAKPEVIRKIQELMADHGGHLKIPKLPVDVAQVRKSWNEKFELKEFSDKKK